MKVTKENRGKAHDGKQVSCYSVPTSNVPPSSVGRQRGVGGRTHASTSALLSRGEITAADAVQRSLISIKVVICAYKVKTWFLPLISVIQFEPHWLRCAVKDVDKINHVSDD